MSVAALFDQYKEQIRSNLGVSCHQDGKDSTHYDEIDADSHDDWHTDEHLDYD